MQVATHDGTFHADDVFAVAALRLRDPGVTIVRSRDRALLDASDARVDVGLRSDPATGDFDHHQRGGAGVRGNGIPYASFGLVWREHGAALCEGDERVAADVDRSLVQGVDAIDTGVTLTESLVDGVRPTTISDLVAGMNPVWDEVSTPEIRDALFEQAVGIAERIIRRQIAAASAYARAGALVREAITGAVDPRIIELDRRLPWFEAVVTGAPEALYVIYPKSDGWGLQAVPRELGSFVNRKDLPAAWAGLDGPALAEVTGVPDAMFCHAARFVAAAQSREGAAELVRQAVAAEG
jgi:uncharacterized UPF0160 family protein